MRRKTKQIAMHAANYNKWSSAYIPLPSLLLDFRYPFISYANGHNNINSIEILNYTGDMADEAKVSGAIDAQDSSFRARERVNRKEETQYNIISQTPNQNEKPPERREDVIENDGENTEESKQQAPSEFNGEDEQVAKVLDTIAQKVFGSSESRQGVYGKISSLYYSRGDPTFINKERRSLEVRRMQAMLYLSYTDLRVEQLENEVLNLKKDIGKLPSDFTIFKPLIHPVYRHEIKRSALQEFELKQQSKSIPPHLLPAIEVLVDQDILKDQGTGGKSVTYQSPRRLRIRPERVATHLEQITGQSFYTHNYPGSDDSIKNSAIVILRPFKVLVIFEMEIRASVQELETKIQAQSTNNNNPTGTFKSAEGKQEIMNVTDKEYNDIDLLADLKLLIQFLDVDLKSTFDLRTRIRESVASTIEFPDLWHLFELGDEVILQSTKNMIYRVVNFTVSTKLSSLLYVN